MSLFGWLVQSGWHHRGLAGKVEAMQAGAFGVGCWHSDHPNGLDKELSETGIFKKWRIKFMYG